ncbi:hypothetical protein CC78DRAFT_211996 [Lojkania enalia]|uniref:Zn(2)-C6 fungal-type domain-containing protein n=1 Tax=Lojkania enalia TaxID=147567 RepID=A0A9P4KC76_9PLEO|nr:hypothetical protein CC78DRAFT_211996 [Didymosphaeria enalia]
MSRTGLAPARLRMSHQNRRLNTNHRRNGKLQACEPCRKGKLRCDHMMPTCGRCARRARHNQCIYHPAPLTKASNIPATEALELNSSPSIASPSRPVDDTLSTIEFPPFEDVNTPTRAQRVNSLPAQTQDSSKYGNGFPDNLRRPLPDNQLRGDSISFLQTAAFVSHTAILTENEVSIGILPSSATQESVVPQSHIDKGAIVLAHLSGLPLFEKYIEKWFSLTRGVILIEPIVKIWSQGLWSIWHNILEAQKADGLRQMSAKIWSNTTKPLDRLLNRNTTPREFFARTTGEDLRWEVIGIIFTLVGMLAQTLQDGDPIFCSQEDPPVNRNALALEAYNAAECCVNFCTDFDIMNDIFLWLLYEYTVVYNSLHAKGSYCNWQKSGYLATALMAYGLHQEIKVDDKTPFFMAEFRKRLFICCYEVDKFTASFVGRPPRLPRQYCRIQLPLDLSDAQVMSDGLDLNDAVEELDGDGWNQRGMIQRCTFARIFAWNALITEEILEISLGFQSSEEIVLRAADIESRAVRLWENLPSFLRIDLKSPWDIGRAPIEMVFLAYIRLADLGHHFLLQRTLIKKVGTDSTKLLTVSREIFSFILVITNHRDTMRDFQMDFTQLLTMYGIPAAAVIGIELLHQEQNAALVANPLPRSDTIQDLSVFVACLGSTRPESGGYAACDRGRRFLRRILDTILDPAQPANTENASSVGGVDDTMFTTPLFQTGNDGDFMRWLESMEWEQDNWINFN